jgi:hypothetical protein
VPLHPNPATDLLPRYIAQVESNIIPHIREARKKKSWGAFDAERRSEYAGTYMPSRGHSRAAVCAKVGLQPRQVVDWAEKGVVRPEIADTVGAGKPRLYSDDNLIEFVLANELLGLGLTVRGAARFLRFLRNRPPAFLRPIGALRLARTRDGRLHVAGLSPCGARHWEVLAGRQRPRSSEDVVLWVVLDLDAARRRLKS